MKRLFLIILVVIGSSNLQAQEIGISTSYQFLSAKEWNKATQVYNFSRPFLENKQPLLKHGFSFGLYYLRKPEARLSWGPSVSFAFHRSSSQNPNFEIGINSLLLDIGTKIQYRPMVKENNNLYMSFTPSITGVMLNRKLNGEVIIVGESEEDQKLRNLGVGLGLNAQVGYDYLINDNLVISPMIGINYSPYIWTSRADVIFNEAAAGDLKSNTSMLGFQGGLILRKRKD
ncbi:hypothetical protein N9933_02990 [bacterium]|nr:hypothetical protein [bacterium]